DRAKRRRRRSHDDHTKKAPPVAMAGLVGLLFTSCGGLIRQCGPRPQVPEASAAKGRLGALATGFIERLFLSRRDLDWDCESDAGELIRGCCTSSFYRNLQNEFCAARMPLNVDLSMRLCKQSLNKPHSKTISLRDLKVGGQPRSLIADRNAGDGI